MRLKEKVTINGMNLYLYERSVYQRRAIESKFYDIDKYIDSKIPEEICIRILQHSKMYVESIGQSLEYNLQNILWFRFIKKNRIQKLIHNLGEILTDSEMYDLFKKLLILENGNRELSTDKKKVE